MDRKALEKQYQELFNLTTCRVVFQGGWKPLSPEETGNWEARERLAKEMRNGRSAS
jgi:hypothetical protein